MILPIQKLSRAEKEIRHERTGKNNIEETIDYYIESANWSTQTSELLSLYNAIEGNLIEEDYKLVQNPYNKQKNDNDTSNYNALLKNFNILKGIANLLMGEFGRRSHEYSVSSLSPSDEVSFKDGLDLVVRNFYAQQVSNTLLELGVDLGQKMQELPTLDEYVADYKKTFDETRVISGQEVLDYIVFNCDLESKYIDLYWDWVITGRFVTYKDVNHDDVNFEVVPVHEFYAPMETHSRYIEDWSYAVRRRYMPMFKVVDLFRGRIDDDIITAMETTINDNLGTTFSDVQMTGRNGFIRLPTLYTKGLNQVGSFTNTSLSTQGIELFHVVYKTFRKYGELTYFDNLSGIERVMEVGEDYKLNKVQGDISIKWKWENEVMEGYKCLGFYLDCKPLLENRADLNQEGLQKLPYNGIMERSISGSIQSIIKDGLPYQRSINVAHYQMEKLINKNKDKILIMPYGLVPRKQGMTTKEQMYHADATSILWVDETAPNAMMGASLIKSVDMSLGTFISETINLIKFIKSEYWDSIGMNAQRYSDVGQNAGKAVTEQAIVRSAIITYELTRQFEKLMEKDYQGLLDLSKLAYIKGKKAKYVRSDGSIAFINMNQDNAVNHSEASYGVFVKDSSINSEAIQAMRNQGLPLVQNGTNPSVIGELWKTKNVTKLTAIINKLHTQKQEYDKIVAQQAQDAQSALQDKINANDKANRDLKTYDIDMTYQGIIDSANIRADSINNSSDEPKAKPANETDILLANHKIDKDNKDLALKDKALNIKKQSNTNK